MTWVNCAMAVTAAWLCVSCGCAASNEQRGERGGAIAADRHEAWGASFVLPPGFSGGENETGGFELTDGELAFMIGRHALADGESLDDFAESRRRALAELGAAGSLAKSEERIGASRALAFRGPGSEGVEVRLLLVRLDPRTGLSFLLVGEGAKVARLDAAWTKLLGSLELPGSARD